MTTVRNSLGRIYGKIDNEILPLVKVFRSHKQFTTLSSCSGHGKSAACIDLATQGISGVIAFTSALNAVQDRAEKRGVWFEVMFNWSHAVATACDFDRAPDWLMFSLQIEGDKGAPNTAELAWTAIELRSALFLDEKRRTNQRSAKQ